MYLTHAVYDCTLGQEQESPVLPRLSDGRDIGTLSGEIMATKKNLEQNLERYHQKEAQKLVAKALKRRANANSGRRPQHCRVASGGRPSVRVRRSTVKSHMMAEKSRKEIAMSGELKEGPILDSKPSWQRTITFPFENNIPPLETAPQLVSHTRRPLTVAVVSPTMSFSTFGFPLTPIEMDLGSLEMIASLPISAGPSPPGVVDALPDLLGGDVLLAQKARLLRSGSVAAVPRPEQTAWQRRYYIPGQIRLTQTFVAADTNDLTELVKATVLVEKRIATDDAALDDILDYFCGFGFEDFGYGRTEAKKQPYATSDFAPGCSSSERSSLCDIVRVAQRWFPSSQLSSNATLYGSTIAAVEQAWEHDDHLGEVSSAAPFASHQIYPSTTISKTGLFNTSSSDITTNTLPISWSSRTGPRHPGPAAAHKYWKRKAKPGQRRPVYGEVPRISLRRLIASAGAMI